MIFFVAVLFLLIISGAEFSKPNEFNKDYISRAGTTAIKGIFVILIMFSHGKGYIDVGGKFDVPYLKMQDHLNQMIVAMFMFYSGYGIMESIKKKGSALTQFRKSVFRRFCSIWILPLFCSSF